MASFDEYKYCEELCEPCDSRGTEPQAAAGRQPQLGVPNPEVIRMLREGGSMAGMGRVEAAPSSEPVWMCISCGKTWKDGKFCAGCGTPRPAGDEGWLCSCGSRGKGAVCASCGAPRPAGVCGRCGWKPAEGCSAPAFCPECGCVIQKEKDKSGKTPDYYWG